MDNSISDLVHSEPAVDSGTNPLLENDIKIVPISLAVEGASYILTNSNLVIAFPLYDACATTEDQASITLDLARMNPIEMSEMASLLDADKTNPLITGTSSLTDDKPIERDREYYLSTVTFEFEDVQFMVPRWGFPENTCPFPLVVPQGDIHVVTQRNVSANQFRSLMLLMYPLDSTPLEREDWISVLKLSTQWRMTTCREQARHTLDNRSGFGCFTLSPEEQILLGQMCGLSDWYHRGCMALASGSHQLESAHGKTLGLEMLVKIARARDKAYQEDLITYRKRFLVSSSFIHNIPTGTPAPDSELSIIDQILKAREDKLYSWLYACYEQLINREETISLEDLRSLGLDTTIELWKARLQLLQHYRKILDSVEPRHALDIAGHIDTEFAQELAEADALNASLYPPPPPRDPIPLPEPIPNSPEAASSLVKRLKKKKKKL